ncbi:MAG: hypothetical protein K1X74_22675 [Pirellulales bacterium]|nr:hypothetical protein [Pirellulales bacterium]
MIEHARNVHAPSDGFWSRARYTPLSDALRGNLSARYDLRRVALAYDLPAELNDRVLQVAKRTRLSRTEKIAVVQELAGHFADGLTAGVDPSRLLEQFGSPAVAARLIRRAKLRQRSSLRRATRAVRLACGWALAIAAVVYAIALVRFWSANPHPTDKYWREVNVGRKVPHGETAAWPLYQEAAQYFYGDKLADTCWHWYTFGGDRKHLGEAIELLKKHATAATLVRRAASQPHLGYVLQSVADGAPPSDHALTAVGLEAIQVIRKAARLMQTEVRLAAQQHDAPRALASLEALLQMADHCRPERACLVEQLVAMHIELLTSTVVSELLATNGEVFSPEQLRDLAHGLAAHAEHHRTPCDMRFERAVMLDLLDRCYSADGHMTAEGMRMINRLSADALSKSYGLGSEQNSGVLSRAGTELTTATLGLMIADRDQQVAVIDRFFDLLARDVQSPPWQWEEPQSQRYIQQIAHDSVPRLRYVIPVLMLPAIVWVERTRVRTAQEADATVTAIALELYRREHGAWPTTLAELTPGLLPQLPVDQCDGQPLRYLVRNGRPLLYSLGGNFVDDGGRQTQRQTFVDYFGREEILSGKRRSTKMETGDWVLWPPTDSF